MSTLVLEHVSETYKICPQVGLAGISWGWKDNPCWSTGSPPSASRNLARCTRIYALIGPIETCHYWNYESAHCCFYDSVCFGCFAVARASWDNPMNNTHMQNRSLIVPRWILCRSSYIFAKHEPPCFCFSLLWLLFSMVFKSFRLSKSIIMVADHVSWMRFPTSWKKSTHIDLTVIHYDLSLSCGPSHKTAYRALFGSGPYNQTSCCRYYLGTVRTSLTQLLK